MRKTKIKKTKVPARPATVKKKEIKVRICDFCGLEREEKWTRVGISTCHICERDVCTWTINPNACAKSIDYGPGDYEYYLLCPTCMKFYDKYNAMKLEAEEKYDAKVDSIDKEWREASLSITKN